VLGGPGARSFDGNQADHRNRWTHHRHGGGRRRGGGLRDRVTDGARSRGDLPYHGAAESEYPTRRDGRDHDDGIHATQSEYRRVDDYQHHGGRDNDVDSDLHDHDDRPPHNHHYADDHDDHDNNHNHHDNHHHDNPDDVGADSGAHDHDHNNDDNRQDAANHQPRIRRRP
jgi:Cd2+/Zn2+-exporting ATPase